MVASIWVAGKPLLVDDWWWVYTLFDILESIAIHDLRNSFLTNQYFMTWHRILSAAMQLHRPIARGLGNRLCHDTTNQAASIICTALFLSHGHPGWIVPSSCSFNYCMTTLITTGTLLHWDIILGWPPMPTIRAPKIRDPERFIAAWSMLILVNPIKQTWVISIFIGYK